MAKTELIAGIDCGTTTGFAVLEGDRLLFAKAFTCYGANHSQLFDSFDAQLRPLLETFLPNYLAIEEPLRTDTLRAVEDYQTDGSVVKTKRPVGTMQTFEMLYGYRAVALLNCAQLRLPYQEANVQSWRSVIYGKERPASHLTSEQKRKEWKQIALRRCKVLGWEVDQPDAAEAAMIADWCRVVTKQRQLGLLGKPDATQEPLPL